MFRPLFGYHRTYRFVLRDLSGRSEIEVQEILGNAATEVEARLRYFVRRDHGHVPENWSGSVERHQLLGWGNDIPHLVSYSYVGKRLLTVWTRVVDGDLRIDLRAAAYRKSSSYGSQAYMRKNKIHPITRVKNSLLGDLAVVFEKPAKRRKSGSMSA